MKRVSKQSRFKSRIGNLSLLTVTVFLFHATLQLRAQTNIFGGQPIDISDAPYQVSIEDAAGNHFCGGTIIDCQWVVSAAHCVTFGDPVRVHAGSTDQTNNNVGQRVLIDQVIVHPSAPPFPVFNGNSDLALLHLAAPLQFNANVQPINYATPQNTTTADIAPGTVAFITGWGDSGNGCCNGILLGANLPIISNQDAAALFTSPGNNCPPSWSPPLNNTMIAFFEEGIAAGPGDSGGPAVITRPDGTRVLIGASSWGGCPRDDFPTVYANIRELSDFIQNNVPPPTACCAPEQDRHITENTTFGTPTEFNGNVYVHTGAQLTITSTVQFAKGKGIIVERGAKLHVNGGTLTRCPNAGDWRGINVEGNASEPQPDAFTMPAAHEAGVVLINNLAHVEWARTAMSTTRYNESWNSAYWGGMVHCENATFLSNRRVAEFMKYDKPNQSKFINCTMESGGVGYAGVTIWDTDNVTFENCRFYNMTSQGILTYDAGAIVRDGSSFQHNERGIEGKATYPYVGKLMIGEMGSTPNYFLDNNRDDIRVESTAFGAGLEVVNNEFFGASTAVRVIGPSRYTIRANSISGSGILGIAAIQTGAMGWNQPNFVDYNGIQKPIGMIANGPNREMQFICNDFKTSLLDFRLFGSTSSGTGEIRANQGGPWSPAGNCFTDPGTEIDILTQGPTSFFTYHALNTQCQRPLNPGNYGVSLTEIANGCEVPPVVGEEPLSEDEYFLLKQQINGGGSSDQLAGWTERKDIVLNGLVADYVSSSDIPSALALLDFEGTTTAKVMKYGVLVGSGDYQAATTELNALPSTDVELTTFKQVQHINLARMQQGLGYELSEPDSAFLESVATSDLGVRSYARALMGLLKGRSYEDDDELDYVPGGGESFGINTGAGKTAVEKVSVFPNPTAGLFTVNLPEGLSAARLQVTAATGQVLLDQPILEGQYRFDIDGKAWGKGMYLLVLRDAGGKSVHAQTIVVSQ